MLKKAHMGLLKSSGVLLLSFAVSGCGAVLSAHATVTPTGVRAEARANTDPRVAAVAGLAATVLGGVVNSSGSSGNGASHSNTTATVHTPVVASGQNNGGGMSVTSTSVTTNSTTDPNNAPTGNSPSEQLSGMSAEGVDTRASAELEAARVSLGRVTGVTIERMGRAGSGSSDVVAGGTVTVEGAPLGRGVCVLDGRIEVETRSVLRAEGSAGRWGQELAQWEIRNGVVLLGDASGHRWRARVNGGSLRLRSGGANSEGRTVWTPEEGTLTVTVTFAGGRELTLDSAAETGIAVANATPTVPLTSGSLAALDELLRAVPSGSEESLRLASAVEVVTALNTQERPTFFAVPVRGRSVVLVVDVSYSMRDVDPRASDLWVTPTARPTKLDVARAELVKFLGALPADVRVDIVAFSSTVNALWRAPRALDAGARSEAIRWVAALRPMDETAPVRAIEAAVALQPEQIVLLSDGRPTDRQRDTSALLGLAQGISARMRLDVVGIGPDQDRPFLAALAQNGRGELRMR